MKRFSFTMLLILSFTIFSVYIVQAQQMMTDSTNQAKKKGVFPIYIQSSGGFTLDGGYCCSANYLFTMSIGYRMSEKAAIGISKTNFQVDDEVKGFGLEYRMTPAQRVIFAAEIGVIDISHLTNDTTIYQINLKIITLDCRQVIVFGEFLVLI
jgi:hypothetical protein